MDPDERCFVDFVRKGVEAIDYLFSEGAYADCKAVLMSDLILLDLNMPEMNSRHVLQVLRTATVQSTLALARAWDSTLQRRFSSRRA